MANTEGVNIVISGDSSQAVNEVEKVTKAIDGVKGTNVKITADASQAIDESGKVSSAMENIDDVNIVMYSDGTPAITELDKILAAEKALDDAHIDITADSSQAVDEANKLADTEEALNDAHVDITADSSQAVGEADKAANALENINDAHTEITADASQVDSEAEKVKKFIAEINGKKITFTVNPLFKDSLGRWHDIHGQFVKMGRTAGEAFSSEFSSASVQGMEKTLGSMLSFDVGGKLADGFSTVLTSITGALQRVAGAVSSVMKSALSLGGGFESVMTSVRVISGAEEEDMDELIKKAREMGATLPISAKDAATAMQLLAQRGMQANDILHSVLEVANLTISQGVDMASSAEILGSTMTNFGIAVDDASKITAIFNNACNQSALSMSKLIEAMKYVGPAAGAVDMQLTEAVAAMEAIANAGLTGEMTGTGLAMVLSKLAQKSQIAGVKTKELDGSMRPLKDIFTELKANGFSLVDAIEAFGQRGSKAALALAKNSDKLAENEERLKNWGSTQSAVDAKAKTFTNTMAALQSAIEEFHIEIFEQIKDQSKEAVGGLAELTREFSKWVGETQIAGKSLNAFIEGLGFKIPSGAGFKELLKQFDVQAFVNKVKNFSSTLRGIGESIADMFDKIKTPLSWLIQHLDTFAQISFWGWILGKGLQIPAAILGIASSITMLANSAKGLLGLSWASLTGLFTNPVGLLVAGAAAVAGGAAYVASKESAARENLQKAIDEEKRYLQEQTKADFLLPVDIQLNFKTGFEKLPEAWTKASDETREQANAFIKELQDNFSVKFVAALDFIARKFPEMAQPIKDMGNVSISTLRQISDALHGDENAFEALPEHLKKVTEHLNAVDAGMTQFGVDLYGISKKYREFKQEVEKPVQKDESVAFFDYFSASLKSITAELPAEIERANKFLSGSDGQLSVQLSLAQAQSKLDKFVKSAKKEYSIGEDIIQVSVYQQLEKLAQAGNTTAQSLINGWKGAGDTLDIFLDNAKEAITYLEVSPDKFMPALASMMNGIQKIDPLTGKITEKFKKAHDALKQWSNVTFDQLTGRVQRLRKAVEGGFIDKSAFEAEMKRVMPQIKLQVVRELQPQKEQYRTASTYKSVVASEFISKVNDLFGDMGMKFMQKTFSGQTGSEIGHSIIAEVERGLSGSSGTFQINGVDQVQQSVNQFTQGLSSIAILPQNISEAVNPYVMKLEQLNSPQVKTSATPSTSQPDFLKLSEAINSAKSYVEANTSALGRASEAVLNLINSSGSTKKGDSFSAVKDYSSEITLVVREIQELGGNIEALRKAATDNTSAITQLQGSFTSTNGSTDSQSVPNDFAHLTNAVQNLTVILNGIQNIQQANSSALGDVINAVHSVENALKSINTGNTFDIDINQQGFMIEKKSDADMLARSTVSALRSGIGNGGI